MNHSKWLRTHIAEALAMIESRGGTFDAERYAVLETQRKEYQEALQRLQNSRNTKSKEIGRLKGEGKSTENIMQSLQEINDTLKDQETQAKLVLAKLHEIESNLPNMPHETVPDGHSEADNQLIGTIGDVPKFDFEPQDHVTLGENSKHLDFERARNMSGSRFSVLTGKLARLHRVLSNWMLDTHIDQHGYHEMLPPFLVTQKSLYHSGQLPKFSDDLFMIESTQLGLIPTAEVPLVNYSADTIYTPEALPLKWVAYTPCFRKEAGSYGKDTRGMIRLHQFEKVELVQIVAPQDSYEALEAMCLHSQAILKALDLPYRVIALCKGDFGFCAAKTYDLEVWLPGENAYREVASISNCEAFQARRLKARIRTEDGNTTHVHTLNGSALPIGRTLVAIMENYQNSDGSITIPEILRDRFGADKI